ncbi:MAG: aminoglycoside N(3)-acetyltransferase [Ardenticatenaceae bacterium]
MSEAGAIKRSDHGPVTVSSLVRDLRALGLETGMTVLVHSSLSSLGWVCGGPVAVVQALEEVLGPAGTLVMPTHSTDLSDPEPWHHPSVPPSWWEVIRHETPAYDPELTPTRRMGVIVECFRGQAGVRRSAHPQVSFAAWGARAAGIVEGHSLAFGLGEESPLARLYDVGAWVLLLGVGHANNTSLHLAEYRADYPAKAFTTSYAPVMESGTRRWVAFRDIETSTDDFVAIGDAFEETGTARTGAVGYATARLMPQPALVDFAVEWMSRNRE